MYESLTSNYHKYTGTPCKLQCYTGKICNLSPLPHLQQVWIQPKVNKNNTKHLAEKCRMMHTVKPQ